MQKENNNMLWSRTQWSSGLIGHVFDQEVMGSNPTAARSHQFTGSYWFAGSHQFFHEEMESEEMEGEETESGDLIWIFDFKWRHLYSAIKVVKYVKIHVCNCRVQRKRLWRVHIKKMLRSLRLCSENNL